MAYYGRNYSYYGGYYASVDDELACSGERKRRTADAEVARIT
jgi:hypothetical protein